MKTLIGKRFLVEGRPVTNKKEIELLKALFPFDGNQFCDISRKTISVELNGAITDLKLAWNSRGELTGFSTRGIKELCEVSDYLIAQYGLEFHGEWNWGAIKSTKVKVEYFINKEILLSPEWDERKHWDEYPWVMESDIDDLFRKTEQYKEVQKLIKEGVVETTSGNWYVGNIEVASYISMQTYQKYHGVFQFINKMIYSEKLDTIPGIIF